MAEQGTLAINADVAKYAGANASSTATAEAYTNVYIKMAEGRICMDTRYDWVSDYAGISAIGKEVLRDATAAYAAIKAIEYDMSGFTSRQEALIMVNILWAIYRETVQQIVKDDKYKEFILTGEGDLG